MIGQKPCKGSKIDKGTLRLGAWVEFKDRGSFKWRHWGCKLSPFTGILGSVTRRLMGEGTTDKVLNNLKDAFDEAKELDGYEELPYVIISPAM